MLDGQRVEVAVRRHANDSSNHAEEFSAANGLSKEQPPADEYQHGLRVTGHLANASGTTARQYEICTVRAPTEVRHVGYMKQFPAHAHPI